MHPPENPPADAAVEIKAPDVNHIMAMLEGMGPAASDQAAREEILIYAGRMVRQDIAEAVWAKGVLERGMAADATDAERERLALFTKSMRLKMIAHAMKALADQLLKDTKGTYAMARAGVEYRPDFQVYDTPVGRFCFAQMIDFWVRLGLTTREGSQVHRDRVMPDVKQPDIPPYKSRKGQQPPPPGNVSPGGIILAGN
jgi:hypothetical protein